MKKLYKATSFREYCFIFDTTRHKTPEDAAYEYATELDDMGDISDIWPVEEASDIPDDWGYRTPLGEKDEGVDCSEFLDKMEWANKISKRLEDAGYELENTFAEDLWRAIKDEDNQWEP